MAIVKELGCSHAARIDSTLQQHYVLFDIRVQSTDAGPASVLEQDIHAGSQATSRVRLLGFFITPVALPETAGATCTVMFCSPQSPPLDPPLR